MSGILSRQIKVVGTRTQRATGHCCSAAEAGVVSGVGIRRRQRTDEERAVGHTGGPHIKAISLRTSGLAIL